MIDPTKLEGILRNLDKYLGYLRQLAAVPRKDLLDDFTKTGSGRYYLQVAFECCLDAANHVIACESLRPPKDYADAFAVLGEAGIVPAEFVATLQLMARMRNRPRSDHSSAAPHRPQVRRRLTGSYNGHIAGNHPSTDAGSVERRYSGVSRMPAADAGFKIAARVSGRQLAEMAGVPCDVWAPSVSEVQTTERLGDRVFRARRGKHRFVVYMEAYTRWKSAARWSILSKSGLLSERERLPTRSLVFILRPRGYRPQGGQFRLAVEDEPTQQIWFREICLWKQQPQAWWDQVPGLMALSPLCRQERSPQEVLTHATEAIAAQAPDPIQRADLLTTLSIFGKMAYPGIDVAGLIGREQMRESKIIEEFQVETRREDILEVLKVRFGSQAGREFAPALDSITDNRRLARLLRLALRSSGLEQFRRRLQRT